MNAVLGYQPGILPDIDQGGAWQDDDTINDGMSRHAHRLRELAIQRIVEVTARERAQRALRSNTRQSSMTSQLHVGDNVEFFRAPSNKEMAGWCGPATIVHIEEDGTIRTETEHLPGVSLLNTQQSQSGPSKIIKQKRPGRQRCNMDQMGL